MAGMLEFKTPMVNMLRALMVRALPLGVGFLLTAVPMLRSRSSTYPLAGVSLTLNVGYLLTAVPMPHSRSSTYTLTGVSLILDVGYLLTATPVKCSRSSRPWTWVISSQPLQRSTATALCGPTCHYEPCCVGPPKTDWSWWRVLTKCGPLEKGMANHFSILALRTP